VPPGKTAPAALLIGSKNRYFTRERDAEGNITEESYVAEPQRDNCGPGRRKTTGIQSSPGSEGRSEGNQQMTMREEQHWICSNPGCKSEVFVIADEGSQAKNPKCSCGSSMKKAYTAPKVKSIVDPAKRKFYRQRFFSKLS
jgi:hypothetical protein